MRLAASCCHDRFCLPCANSRSRLIAANVLPYVQPGKCRFVTLTLRHTDQPLNKQIDRLYASFKRLRKDPLWSQTQEGGVAFLEIKRSKDKQSWHPHFHVLTQGSFIDVRALSALWKRITGDSFVVDVRFVRGASQVLSYVTKYASKPFDPSLFDYQSVLVQAINALAGRRMALSFGKWKGLQMSERPDGDAWENLGSLEDVLYEAAKGDAEARQLIMKVCGEKAELMIRMAGRLLANRPVERPPRVEDGQLFFLEPPTPYERFLNSELSP